MAYDDKAHCNTHQLKMRLNDDDYPELKEVALELKLQPGALAREIIRAALQFKREHGYLPLLDEKKISA